MRAQLTIPAFFLALGAAAPVLAAPIEVLGAHFFAERGDADGVSSVETNRIPYEPDSVCYRWVLDVKPDSGVRGLRERMTLPGAAAQWGGVDGVAESPTAVAPSRDAAETDFIVALAEGTISHGWCVAKGDPQGDYRIEVFEGSRLLHRFDFTVGRAGARRRAG